MYPACLVKKNGATIFSVRQKYHNKLWEKEKEIGKKKIVTKNFKRGGGCNMDSQALWPNGVTEPLPTHFGQMIQSLCINFLVYLTVEFKIQKWQK